MTELPELAPSPELVFGLVAPIGVDLDLVTEALSQALGEMSYQVHPIRLTRLMAAAVPTGLPLRSSPYVQSFKDRIAYANEIRRLLGDAALASLAISAIRTYRADENSKKKKTNSSTEKVDEEEPLNAQAYIIRQFKRPEEISLLRRVYGRQFILISAFTPQEARLRLIKQRETESCGGLISDVEAHTRSYELIAQDAKEIQDEHGQNVRDAYPLGDVFVDASSKSKCEEMIRRFIHALFGNNEITPTHDEYGMYIAKSASLRSSDLSRQVGAAIFRESGEVITMGCNEVPRSGGGTYWTGDPTDKRDMAEGHDPNERRKIELLVDVLDRLKKGSHLSDELKNIDDTYEIGKKLLEEKSDHSIKESKLMDLLEFGRIIHAEMSAICDVTLPPAFIQR